MSKSTKDLVGLSVVCGSVAPDVVVSVVSVVETSDRYAPAYELLQLEEFEATNSESSWQRGLRAEIEDHRVRSPGQTHFAITRCGSGTRASLTSQSPLQHIGSCNT